MLPKLEHWVQYHDALVGQAFNHPDFPNDTRVVTNHCHELDLKLGIAKCVAGEVWQLGKPGVYEEYLKPSKPKSFLQRMIERYR